MSESTKILIEALDAAPVPVDWRYRIVEGAKSAGIPINTELAKTIRIDTYGIIAAALMGSSFLRSQLRNTMDEISAMDRLVVAMAEKINMSKSLTKLEDELYRRVQGRDARL